MNKWEYLRLDVQMRWAADNLWDLIEKAGLQGWEMVGPLNIDVGNTTHSYLLFKRPLRSRN